VFSCFLKVECLQLSIRKLNAIGFMMKSGLGNENKRNRERERSWLKLLKIGKTKKGQRWKYNCLEKQFYQK